MPEYGHRAGFWFAIGMMAKEIERLGGRTIESWIAFVLSAVCLVSLLIHWRKQRHA